MSPRRDPAAIIAAYEDAYKAANGHSYTSVYGKLRYEAGWVERRYGESDMLAGRYRLRELEAMTARLLARATPTRPKPEQPEPAVKTA